MPRATTRHALASTRQHEKVLLTGRFGLAAKHGTMAHVYGFQGQRSDTYDVKKVMHMTSTGCKSVHCNEEKSLNWPPDWPQASGFLLYYVAITYYYLDAHDAQHRHELSLHCNHSVQGIIGNQQHRYYATVTATNCPCRQEVACRQDFACRCLRKCSSSRGRRDGERDFSINR